MSQQSPAVCVDEVSAAVAAAAATIPVAAAVCGCLCTCSVHAAATIAVVDAMFGSLYVYAVVADVAGAVAATAVLVIASAGPASDAALF